MPGSFHDHHIVVDQQNTVYVTLNHTWQFLVPCIGSMFASAELRVSCNIKPQLQSKHEGLNSHIHQGWHCSVSGKSCSQLCMQYQMVNDHCQQL